MSEQDIIEKYFSKHSAGDDVVIGIGDDAAIVTPPVNAKLVITTDTLIEGSHFYPDTDPFSLGHKCLAVSLSDLAAMGSSPLWATLNISLNDIKHTWLEKFSNGLFSLAEKYNVKIIGGDLVRGCTSFTVQVIGYIKSDKPLTRSGAKNGDLIYVSGTVGDAALGLKLLTRPGEINISDKDEQYFLHKYHMPEPRLELGEEISSLANAAIDISDGMLIDMQRILSSSNVGAEINLEKIPFSSYLQNQVDLNNEWKVPLTGGEDYEIIFTCSKAYQDKIHSIQERLNCSITQIGRIDNSGNLTILNNGEMLELPENLGFDHFS